MFKEKFNFKKSDTKMYGHTDSNDTIYPHVPFHCDALSISYVASITFILTFGLMACVNCRMKSHYEKI